MSQIYGCSAANPQPPSTYSSTPTSTSRPALAPISIHPADLYPTQQHPYQSYQDGKQPQQRQQQQQQLPPSPPITPQPKQELTLSARSLMHHRLHPNFVGKYSLGEELGSGGFGFVVSATDRMTGTERAVKFIFRHKVPAHAWARDPELGPIPMEIYVLKHVRHPNVVGYVDFYQDETFLYLVMELHGTQWSSTAVDMRASASSSHSPALSQASEDSYYSSSPRTPIDEHLPTPPSPQQMFARRTSCDLFECIERHHNFDEPLAKQIFRQIVDCIAYLDTLGICHRDIKDENIVIDDQFRVTHMHALFLIFRV